MNTSSAPGGDTSRLERSPAGAGYDDGGSAARARRTVISLTPKVSPMRRNERPSVRRRRALASRSGLMALGRPPLRPRSAAVATLVGCAEGRSYQASGSAGRQTGTPAWRSDSGRGRGTLKRGVVANLMVGDHTPFLD